MNTLCAAQCRARLWGIVVVCLLLGVGNQAHASDDLEKFIYLENKLIRRQGVPAHPAEHVSVMKYGISVVSSYVFSKILEYALWRRIESPWLKHGIYYLTPGASDYSDACHKINNVVFGALVPLFLFMLSAVYDPEPPSDAAILEAFVKKWPAHKSYTPERFQAVFSALYDYYIDHKKLTISETSAHLVLSDITKIIVDFIIKADKKNENELEYFQSVLSGITLPDFAAAEVEKEMAQLKKMSSDAGESIVIEKHIELIVTLPWGKYTPESNDLAAAKNILNREHYGLARVKERILDYLAVRALSPHSQPPILCLVGPPGIGKTSIGYAIAQCMGKKFSKVSLGGVSDEAEIRGHRKTYVGAMPGRFIQALRNAQTSNPVILLDEIDKMGGGVRGDPCAALLEVLDPGQNAHFCDAYLGIPFDLSRVLFIATANESNKIPKPLRDRLEIITLSGYTFEEKMEIAKRHILPKAIANAGLADKGFVLDDTVLAYIIKCSAHEPGVREIERCVCKLCARFARHVVEHGSPLVFDVAYATQMLEEGA